MAAQQDLQAWLASAWELHTEAPARVAAELAARAAELPDDTDGAEALRLAEHVLLAHLHDPAALQRLLQPLQDGAALRPALQRARWVLAQLDGSPAAAPPPDAARWSALQNLVLLLAARGEAAAVQQRLLADEAAALAHAEPAARRAYAASANNVASHLRTGARGDAARDMLMLAAAALARRAWEAAGTWMHVERADHQLAMCHAAVGDGAAAVAHGRACLARCEAEGADAAERFFAHECLVHAWRAAGDVVQAAVHRSAMVALLDAVDDAGLREGCRQTLAATPG